MNNKYSNVESSIKRLWEYIYNIERVHSEEIKELKRMLNLKAGVSELTCEGKGVAASDEREWPTLPTNPTPPQPSQTSRQAGNAQESGTAQGPGRAAEVPVADEHDVSSLSALLADEISEPILIDDEANDIPCGQMSKSQWGNGTVKTKSNASSQAPSPIKNNQSMSRVNQNAAVQVPSPQSSATQGPKSKVHASPIGSGVSDHATQATGHATGGTRDASSLMQTPVNSRSGVITTTATQFPSPTNADSHAIPSDRSDIAIQASGPPTPIRRGSDSYPNMAGPNMQAATSHSGEPANQQSQVERSNGNRDTTEWQTATNNRRNRRRNGRQDDNREKTRNEQANATLRGIRREQAVELYVQNIARYNDESDQCVADKLRNYCKNKGIRIMAVRVISNRYCEDMVGCKISVPVRQVDDALGTRIWPDDVVCRRWRKPRQNAPADRGDNGGDGRGRPQRRDDWRNDYERDDRNDRQEREVNYDWYGDDDYERYDEGQYNERSRWVARNQSYGERGYWINCVDSKRIKYIIY